MTDSWVVVGTDRFSYEDYVVAIGDDRDSAIAAARDAGLMPEPTGPLSDTFLAMPMTDAARRTGFPAAQIREIALLLTPPAPAESGALPTPRSPDDREVDMGLNHMSECPVCGGKGSPDFPACTRCGGEGLITIPIEDESEDEDYDPWNKHEEEYANRFN